MFVSWPRVPKICGQDNLCLQFQCRTAVFLRGVRRLESETHKIPLGSSHVLYGKSGWFVICSLFSRNVIRLTSFLDERSLVRRINLTGTNAKGFQFNAVFYYFIVTCQSPITTGLQRLRKKECSGQLNLSRGSPLMV